MSNVITNHAVENVWCTPNQDLQVIYRPQRISPPRGTRDEITHMWEAITMPTKGDVYHVYQIGQYPPLLVGLSQARNIWRTFRALMEEEKLFADLYTIDGRHLVRGEAWVLVTRNHNVLIAVKDQPHVANLRHAELFVRLYSNAYFNTPRGDGNPNEIKCRFKKVQTAKEALDFQRAYQAQSQVSPGFTTLFVNGLYADDYPQSSFKVGDYLEYVYDSSIKSIKDFKIKDLLTFDSDLDLKRKYLLSYPGSQEGSISIDYRDDIDLYLIKPGSNNHFEGVYVHKNNDDALRQVTHRDYSFAVDYAVGYQQYMKDRGWQDVNDLTLRMVIRESGYSRPLVYENNRINELYKLPYADRIKAMVGVDSTVENWRAPVLENSPYIKLMDTRKRGITPDLVRDAYGYNALARLLGESPLKVVAQSGRKTVRLPFATQLRSTVFELDNKGKLLASYIHTSGFEYTPFNAACDMIEVEVGIGGSQLDMFYDMQDVEINPLYSYRFYMTPIAHGILQHDKWEDVTGQDDKYAIINGKVHWYVDTDFNAVCVKSDAYFLNYELDLTGEEGIYRFSVTANALWDGERKTTPLHIAPGKLTVWANNECLIEGIDYQVQWPQVILTNKRYLKSAGSQRIRVRCTGFCDTVTMKHEQPKEVGFVRWGQLSRNTRFDLRDDRVIRLVVNGRTYHRSAVSFTEGSNSVWMNNVPNGSPYILEDVVVPLRKNVNGDTYELRALSRAIDQSVSDYLTQKLPETIPVNPDPIVGKYEIYSPFTAKLIHDLITGQLDMAPFQKHYSDQDVRQGLDQYVWLLDYEPTRKPLDKDHVAVHPHDRYHVMELDVYQYMLLNRAIKVFLDDKVDITQFVRIKDSFI